MVTAPAKLKPIPYAIERIAPRDLILGFHGDHVDFVWSPYRLRSLEHREDYDRLIVSLWHDGLQCPLITHRGNVLVGQRRAEILKRLAPHTPIPCANITEDVSRWTRDDIPRLDELKKVIGEHPY